MSKTANVELHVNRLLANESRFRRNRRLAVLVATFCMVLVIAGALNIINDVPRFWQFLFWAFAAVAIWSHLRIRMIDLVRWCRSHPAV